MTITSSKAGCLPTSKLQRHWLWLSIVYSHNQAVTYCTIYIPCCVFTKHVFVSSPQYLGSMLVKELRGTESTQDACAKMRVKHCLTHYTAAANMNMT